MERILHLDFSPRGERSHSRRLTREFVEQQLAAHPAATVTYRDLGRAPVPPVDEPWIAAAYTPEAGRTPEMREALRLSDALVDELLAADVIVLGVPMYNFGVTASFKAWIDQVVRAGRTFSSRDYSGLATGKRAYVLLAAGQDFAPGSPAAGMDHVTPYLRTVFGFIGITNLTVIPVATGGPEALQRTSERARQTMAAANASTLAA